MNGGDDTVSATDDGLDWTPPGSTSGVTATGGESYNGYSGTITLDSSVPDGTPTEVFETELYGDQEWTFSDSIQSGAEYEVRLYFAEIYHGVDGGNPDGGVGDRVFDVAIEGQTVLDGYDIYADVGAETGVMKSFTVTPTDGTIDVDFTTVEDNAKVSAVEVVPSDPEPNTLGGPSSVDFGTVVVDESSTETVTLTNLGESGDPDITIDDVSLSGDDASEFAHDFSGSVTLAPGESTTVDVTFSPSDAEAKAASMAVSHSGTNSPLTVDLQGEGASSVPVGFSKSQLQGFSAGNPTALDVGPDDRVYVSTQGGTVYALEVERTGEDSYQVVHEEQIDAIKDIPNHDDLGNLDSDDNRQITGLTVGGTAAQPEVYVSSSDPEIRVGDDTDTTDTNSGAISRLSLNWNDDGTLAGVEHDVMVLGLPRSEENHATNGLDLTDGESTLYVAQGGHTNKGAPGDNFGHTSEYALAAAVLEIDLAQIEGNHQGKSLQDANSQYPDLDYYYAIPTVQGGDLPFGGNDGLNQAKWVADGPVQVYSPGYRNPYDLVLSEDDQLYVIDNGPNGGWGGIPVGDGPEGDCTNAPNEDGSYGTGDQLHLATEGSYGGHAAPIRANPDDAGLYDANGNQYHDFDASDTPVPFDMANPVECDYQDPSEDNSIGPTFGWTGGITEYTGSNFGGAMSGDLLVVEAGTGTIKRVQLNAAGDDVTDVSSPMSHGGALGITAQGDDEAFAGTVWTANHGGNDVTVFEPNDFEDGGDGTECTGDYDSSLDEDGDGYDNADEIDAGSDPCSAASTPPDFDDDGTSNLNDPDDDNDGIDDTQDVFAVDADNGLTNDLPATYDFAPNSHPGTILDLGFTGVMMNGQDYQDLYDPDEVTAGGAANVLTVENVGQGDAHQSTNTQQHGYQVGVNADEPFTVESTVNGLSSDAEPFQSQGVFVGTGDQDNYVKLTATGFSDGGGSGVQLAKEEAGSFTGVANPSAPTAGNATTLSMTVYPSNGTVEAYYAVNGGEEQFLDETTVPTSWFDTADGNGTAVGVIATSNGADSTFDATWQYLYAQPLQDELNQPPTADAGADQTVDENTTVQLDASGSSDPDDDMLGYTWTQLDGPDVSLNANDAVDPTFTAPDVDAETTLTFEVSVSDGELSDTDTVNVTVQDVDDGGAMTIEEAVASYGDGDDSTIEFDEIQQAINWWQEEEEVPGTDAETIDFQTIQELINLWQTGETVGDGNDAPTASFTASPSSPVVGEEVTFDASASSDPDGEIVSYEWDFDGDGTVDATGETATHTYESTGDYDVTLTVEDADGATDSATQTVTVSEATADPGSVAVSVTPDSGTDASTYTAGSFTVENTGEQEIESITFDLSSGAMPDMVWDPDGTAGDQAAKGLQIDSESGDGVGVVSTADGDVFSQPHNGVDGADGYDVLTVEFTDFEPGESMSFSADNDPTSIKGATVGSQEAGPVSGLELTRSTISVEYADSSAQVSHLFGDGSAGGAQATLDGSVAGAPSIGISDVALDDSALREHHSAATVTEADQTVTISGEPGETVTLLHFEAELELDDVPDTDSSGADGYDIEDYEANKIEQVNYQTATLDSNGEAEVPVTLFNTTDVGGYNHFVATHGEPGAETGLDSNVVVLKYEQDTDGGDGVTTFATNAGGSEYTASDGTVFEADTAFTGGSTYSTAEAIDNTQDDPLYQTERYGDFSYDVPLEDGTYEVTLHFAEIYQGVSPNDNNVDEDQTGDRLFDVSIEGEQVLSEYDIYAEAGGSLIAVQETFIVEITDGELNVAFSTIEDNAKVSAIEVEPADGGGDAPAEGGSADISVTENGGIDASTFGGGSFEVTNTGDQQISSVEFDLSESLIPDAVFDPDGTAGDTTAKGLVIDSESGDGVGVVSTADGDVFSQPHNGVDGEDGYDVLTVEFTDFEPGESMSFSVDIDPTTIKGASTTGGAGSVSGLELSGSSVNLEYADGSMQGTDLFGDGSDGGAQATADGDVASAPTLGVDGVTLQSTDFPAHEAATVGDASQTLTLSGPADGTVELLHVEASEPPSDGYDLDEFEADNAQSVSYQTVTLDSNGEATVSVSLSESNLDYFVATAQNDAGDTGETSNVVILDDDSSAGEGQTLHRVNAGEDTTLSATDDGPDWTGVADTSSPYLASVAESESGNYCGGDDVTPDSTVPSSTPDAVFDCERYGNSTWKFSVDSGQEVEVRLYLSNQFPGASEPGDREFNVSIEDEQVLTNYDPVADVGHATGTMKSFTVTDDGDGTITISFETGEIENPQVNAIEIVETEGS